jgi:ribosome-binding factor A
MTTNRKTKHTNQALMPEIYFYSNQIIEKACKINELENIVTTDSEKDSLIM